MTSGGGSCSSGTSWAYSVDTIMNIAHPIDEDGFVSTICVTLYVNGLGFQTRSANITPIPVRKGDFVAVSMDSGSTATTRRVTIFRDDGTYYRWIGSGVISGFNPTFYIGLDDEPVSAMTHTWIVDGDTPKSEWSLYNFTFNPKVRGSGASLPTVMYVKVAGDDSRDGSSWNLSKATVNAGINGVASNGLLYVELGDYGSQAAITLDKTLTIAPEAITPCRFWLPSTGAADVKPVFGSWSSISNGDRLKCVRTRISSAMIVKDMYGLGGSGFENILGRQYVSEPISGNQTISGTIKGQMLCRESSGQLNATIAISIRVVSNDGNTIRGTLLALRADDYSVGTPPEFATSFINRPLQLVSGIPAALTLSVVNALDGDRIVIEIGIREVNTSTARYATINFGDNSATDLAEDTSTTTQNNPWIEFSQGIRFNNQVILPLTA